MKIISILEKQWETIRETVETEGKNSVVFYDYTITEYNGKTVECRFRKAEYTAKDNTLRIFYNVTSREV